MPIPSPAADRAVDAALARWHHRRDALLQVLRETQQALGWLPRPAIERTAVALGLTPAVVEGVASFYRFLHLAPAGAPRLLWSDSVVERMAGSRTLAAALAARLGVPLQAVAEPQRPYVGFASCIGLADQGPSLLVDHRQVLTRMDVQRVDELAQRVLAGEPPDAWPAHWRQVDDGIRRAGPLLGGPPLRGEAIAAALAHGADATLATLQAAGLRGRGGAGFPTARKWAACRAAPLAVGATRVVVCNADEGEPGTFKDRALLMRQADTVIEGMTVAAVVLGARQGYLYLRGEYAWLHDALVATLAARRGAGLLGTSILGRAGLDFDIELHLGAGAYVCGEESALIESLEGKRGTPRIRPPFPVERGHLGRPTVVNNVETWVAAARIVAAGGATDDGTRLHSVAGDVARPGVYEVPVRTTVRGLLAESGAADTLAVQVGGPSGTCVDAAGFDRVPGSDDLPTAGAFTVFGRHRDPFDWAHAYAGFFAHESCGFCTPCRVGTELVRRRMDKLDAGFGSPFDAAELHDLQALMHAGTHCGLGASATNPLRDTLRLFPQAYARRTVRPRFVPGFDLDAELESARRATGRDDAGAHLERLG